MCTVMSLGSEFTPAGDKKPTRKGSKRLSHKSMFKEGSNRGKLAGDAIFEVIYYDKRVLSQRQASYLQEIVVIASKKQSLWEL